MSFIGTIEKSGAIPVQDFSFRTGKRKGKISVGRRAVRYGVRITDREDDPGQLGHWVIDEDVIGDFLDGVGWPHQKPPQKEAGQIDRENGAWMGAWPAVLTQAPPPQARGKTSSGPLPSNAAYKARPLFQHPSIGLKDDTRFIELEVIPAIPDLKKGTKGIVLNLTHEDKQVAVFMPITSDKLIAHWLNGPNDQSSTVYDIGPNGEIDPNRNARIDTTWKVRQWIEPCAGATSTGLTSAKFGVAINGMASPKGPGYIFTTFPGMDALFSYLMFGPLRTATLRHKFGDRSVDGPLVAGALDTKSYFTGGNEPYDGPLRFIEEPYPEVNDSIHPYEVFRKMDFRVKHPFCNKMLPGVWKEYVRIPITETPPCTPTKNHDTISGGDGNPSRLYDHSSNMLYMGKFQGNGEVWQPRVGVNRGAPSLSTAEKSKRDRASKSVSVVTGRKENDARLVRPQF